MHRRSRLRWFANRIPQTFITGFPPHFIVRTCCLQFRRIAMTLNNPVETNNSKSRYAAPKDNAAMTSVRRSMRLVILAAVCALLLGFAGQLQAQLSTATMFGTVTDPAGAAIANAKITLTQTDTGFVRTVVTNGDGTYRADFLPIGPYAVTAEATGFKKLDRTGITLTVTEEAHLDLSLSIGAAEQTIEVKADIPLLNTGNSTLGRTITNVEIDNLPLVDRNVYTLLDLTPGVQNNNSAGTGANGGVINPLGYPEQHVKINGSSDSGVGQVSYYLDGGSDMTGVRNTGNPLPNPDAIREFSVQTNNYSA